jgi:hypothetical protein
MLHRGILGAEVHTDSIIAGSYFAFQQLEPDGC